jgi:toxin ParE1/3/4
VIRFTFSPAAKRDMAEIWFSSADRWGIDQADHYVQQIEHDLTAAANGSPLVRPLDRYWSIKSGNHFCVFRRDMAGQIIVLRVLHERRDMGVIESSAVAKTQHMG